MRHLLASLLLLLLLLLPCCRAVSLSSQLITRDEAPVLVELYYESLCPGCRAFLTTQLFPAYTKLQDTGIMKVALYPYGNAHETQNPDGSWKFECQHGDNECKGNLLEVCLLKHLNWDFHLYLPVINCIEGAEDPISAAEHCITKLSKVSYKEVKTCAKGPEGNSLMHDMGNRTESLEPGHTYVPWIVVEGKHTEKLEEDAMKDLVALVCKLYQGKKPSQCSARETEVVEDSSCVLCKYFISTVDKILSDKTNEQEIKEVLERLCSQLPSSVTQQCDTFIKTYTDLIIDLVTKDVSPALVCEELGLCPAV